MKLENETQYEGQSDKAPKQESKSTVNYGPGIEGQDCLGCEHFQEPDRCHRVRGEISPTGTCDLWTSPSQVEGFEFGDSESIEEILFGGAED